MLKRLYTYLRAQSCALLRSCASSAHSQSPTQLPRSPRTPIPAGQASKDHRHASLRPHTELLCHLAQSGGTLHLALQSACLSSCSQHCAAWFCVRIEMQLVHSFTGQD